MDKGVNISGNVSVGGSIVGGDLNTGGAGEVACDFIWKGAALKGLCFPEDQAALQKILDDYLNGSIPKETMFRKLYRLSPNLESTIERLEGADD